MSVACSIVVVCLFYCRILCARRVHVYVHALRADGMKILPLRFQRFALFVCECVCVFFLHKFTHCMGSCTFTVCSFARLSAGLPDSAAPRFISCFVLAARCHCCYDDWNCLDDWRLGREAGCVTLTIRSRDIAAAEIVTHNQPGPGFYRALHWFCGAA